MCSWSFARFTFGPIYLIINTFNLIKATFITKINTYYNYSDFYDFYNFLTLVHSFNCYAVMQKDLDVHIYLDNVPLVDTDVFTNKKEFNSIRRTSNKN